MSMPRKAMKELGFQACCLWCDAPDDAGAERCRPCIDHHRNVREVLASAPTDDPFYQLAKEIMAMAAAPHRYDHDEAHGPTLRNQQRLAGVLTEPEAPLVTEDIEELFAQQRGREKESLIRQIGNQNPWKDGAPSADIARVLGEEEWSGEVLELDEHYGARTVPSRPIEPINRDERSGEDTALTDRVQAAAKAAPFDEDMAQIIEVAEFERRQEARKNLKSAMKEVKELIDDDLEF